MILDAIIAFALGVVLTWQFMRKPTSGDYYP
jgi:hypothetical protein